MAEWRYVVDFEDSYEVSSDGKVRSLDRFDVAGRRRRQQVIRSQFDRVGREQVSLRRNRGKRTLRVHRIVAAAFFGPAPLGMEVCHRDGNPANNHVDNLYYGTKSENAQDTLRHGRNFYAARAHCKRGHLLVEPNLRPGQVAAGKRYCRTCDRTRAWSSWRGRPFDDTHAAEVYRELMAA